MGEDESFERHAVDASVARSEEHTSELQSPCNLVCRLLLEKKKTPAHSFQSKSSSTHISSIKGSRTFCLIIRRLCLASLESPCLRFLQHSLGVARRSCLNVL